MNKSISPETVTTIIDVGFTVARHLIEAFSRGDKKEIERLSEVLPDTLKSKLALQLGKEKARRELGGK